MKKILKLAASVLCGIAVAVAWAIIIHFGLMPLAQRGLVNAQNVSPVVWGIFFSEALIFLAGSTLAYRLMR